MCYIIYVQQWQTMNKFRPENYFTYPRIYFVFDELSDFFLGNKCILLLSYIKHVSFNNYYLINSDYQIKQNNSYLYFIKTI